MIYKLLFMFCFFIRSIQGQNSSVTVKVFYETYDFDSRLFIATELSHVAYALNDDVAVEMYAYGNAKTDVVDDKLVFTCENGPEECVGNTVDACAVNFMETSTAIMFILCITDPWNGLNGQYSFPNIEECGKIIPQGIEIINECIMSETGSNFLRKNGVATDLMNPQYLPLVLINGVEWKTDDDVSLYVAVCEALVATGLKPLLCF